MRVEEYGEIIGNNSLNFSAQHIKLNLPEDTPQKASKYKKLIEDLKDKGIEISWENYR